MARFFQFPAKVEPLLPPAAPAPPHSWYSNWSEPVRQKIAPALAVALISASGSFSPVLPPPSGAVASPVATAITFTSAFQYQGYTAPVQIIAAETVTADKWIFAWSEPVRTKPGLTASQQQFLASIPFNADQGIYPKWGFPWSEPVRAKPGLAATQQQTLAAVPFVEGQDLYPKWGFQWSEPVRSKSLATAQQQSLAWAAFVTTPEVITVDKWLEPLSDPIRIKTSVAVASQQFFNFDTDPVVSFGWFEGLVDPYRAKPWLLSASQQTFTVDTRPIVSFGWFGNLVDPPKPKTSISAAAQQAFAVDTDPVVSFGWDAALIDPVRQKPGLGVALQQFSPLNPYGMTQPENVTEDRWHQGWPDIIPAKKSILAAQQQFLAFYPFPFSGEVVTVDKWFEPLSSKLLAKPALPTAEQQFLALVKADPFPETTTVDRYWVAFADPVRPKPGLWVWLQRSLALNEQPIVSFGWQVNYADPTRRTTGKVQTNQAYAPFTTENVTLDKWFEAYSEPRRVAGRLQFNEPYAPFTAETITLDKWFAPYSEPIRRRNIAVYQPLPSTPFQQVIPIDRWLQPWSVPSRLSKPGLLSSAQAFTAVTLQPPAVLISEWLYGLANPVRTKPGLLAALQVSAVYPPRILPTSVIVSMAAVEDNQDVFEGAIMTSAPAARCLVSIQEIVVPSNNPTSVFET